jgi:hypothetical protein
MPDSAAHRLPTARTITVTTNDARELAKRLLARGMSAASTAGQTGKSDLKLAGRLLLLTLEDYRDQAQLAVDAE